MIAISVHGLPITHNVFKFPGGEIQVQIPPDFCRVTQIIIKASIVCSDDLMELLLITDALRNRGAKEISLIMPYIPYARQDRVCNPGEALSLKVFCDLINAQKYETVTVWDAHSDVALALLDRVVEVPQHDFVSRIKVIPGTILVAPDAGAMKKVFKSTQALGCEVIRADKTRDVKTGQITGTVVHSGKLDFHNLLIVDDICDGGRTFIELAKALQPLTKGRIELYVTHGIFSQGLGVFDGLIDQIYCPNVFPGVHEHLATLSVGRSPYAILQRI